MQAYGAIPSSEPERGAPSGDVIPCDCAVVEVLEGELKQLFNSIDPSLRGEIQTAEEFIVAWAKHLPSAAALSVFDLDR